MVEPARFALTSTPSIGPSSAEVTWPESVCAVASGAIRKTGKVKDRIRPTKPRIVASHIHRGIPLLTVRRRNAVVAVVKAGRVRAIHPPRRHETWPVQRVMTGHDGAATLDPPPPARRPLGSFRTCEGRPRRERCAVVGGQRARLRHQ